MPPVPIKWYSRKGPRRAGTGSPWSQEGQTTCKGLDEGDVDVATAVLAGYRWNAIKKNADVPVFILHHVCP